MPSVRITTTRGQDLQSLMSAGQATADMWSALRSLLLRDLGPGHAHLLAEPAVNPVRGEIDWYADVEGEVRPLSALPHDEQEAARGQLARLVADVLAVASRLRSSPNDGERFLSEMLELSMQVPDEASVYVAAGHPVLVAWGYAKAGPAIERVHLSGMLPASSRPMPIAPPPIAPVPVERSTWSVLITALALASLMLLVSAFLVLRDPLGWYDVQEAACAVLPGQLDLLAALHTAESHQSDLRLQLAQLSTDAGARRLQCRPPEPPPPPQIGADEQRARDRGAKRGKVTIILAWDDRNDLDLHVICPAGTEIYYKRRSACGGMLDVDANGDARTSDVTPVENVFFTEPQPGVYRVIVDPYAMRVATASRFRLTVKREGRPDEVIEGMANNGAHSQEVTSFTLEPPP